MSDDSYTAKNIRILSDDEINEFDWAKSGKLAAQYKLPLDFVGRGFECSRRLGINTQYFIDKYLKKKSVEVVPEFEEVYKEILKENDNSKY